jgi:hypothetical protein
MSRRIYVIELDPEVWKEPRFRRQNTELGDRTPRGYYYVGQTGLSVEERFKQHMRGFRSNRYVKRYGRRLVMNLMQEKYWPPQTTTSKAEAAERRRADSLRKRGCAVYSA